MCMKIGGDILEKSISACDYIDWKLYNITKNGNKWADDIDFG